MNRDTATAMHAAADLGLVRTRAAYGSIETDSAWLPSAYVCGVWREIAHTVSCAQFVHRGSACWPALAVVEVEGGWWSSWGMLLSTALGLRGDAVLSEVKGECC